MFASRRLFSGALNLIPSTAEGVLNSAERGGFRGDQNPLQRLSTRKVYDVTPVDVSPATMNRVPVPGTVDPFDGGGAGLIRLIPAGQGLG